MKSLATATGCLFLLTSGVACFSEPASEVTRQVHSLPYDFSKPTSSIELPSHLREISGLTDVDARTVACVQDEVGAVFYIDLSSGSVSKTLAFGPSGDYEGLTRVGDAFWVVRSDGLLLELVPHRDRLRVRRRTDLDIGHDDVEGLGYDAERRVLLVAPKDPPAGRKKERDERRVFTHDPVGGEQLETLALSTSLERIVAEAERAGIALPTRTTRKGAVKTRLKVRFSAIAVHPQSGELYAASATDNALFAFDRESRLCSVHFFDDDSLQKIEGISFTENGDLILSSEGTVAPPLIQVFQYRDGQRACAAGAKS